MFVSWLNSWNCRLSDIREGHRGTRPKVVSRLISPGGGGDPLLPVGAGPRGACAFVPSAKLVDLRRLKTPTAHASETNGRAQPSL